MVLAQARSGRVPQREWASGRLIKFLHSSSLHWVVTRCCPGLSPRQRTRRGPPRWQSQWTAVTRSGPPSLASFTTAHHQWQRPQSLQVSQLFWFRAAATAPFTTGFHCQPGPLLAAAARVLQVTCRDWTRRRSSHSQRPEVTRSGLSPNYRRAAACRHSQRPRSSSPHSRLTRAHHQQQQPESLTAA